MTYDNIQSHKKPGLHPLSRRDAFGNFTGVIKLTLSQPFNGWEINQIFTQNHLFWKFQKIALLKSILIRMLANRTRRDNCPILAFFEDIKPSFNFKLSQIKNNVKGLTAIELSLFNSKNLLSPTSWLISLLAIKLQSKDFLFWSSTVAISFTLQQAFSY